MWRNLFCDKSKQSQIQRWSMVGAWCTLASSVYGVSTYHVASLGTLGGDFSTAYAINNQNQVVGWSTTSANEFHVFLWQASTGMTDLNIPAYGGAVGFRSGYALYINQQGGVVGNSLPSSIYWYQGQAFTWNSQSGLTDLGMPTLWLTGYNNSSLAVGYTLDDEGFHSYTIDATNTIQSLTSAGMSGIRALQINNQGQILVQAHDDGNLIYKSCILNSNGSLITISDPRYTNIQGGGMNDQGTVIGYADDITTGATIAFIWDATNGLRNLYMGDLDGPDPLAINNCGQVIGLDENLSTGEQIWTLCEDGKAYNIAQLLAPASAGWTNIELNGINDQGDMVGLGTLNGKTYAILLTPDVSSVPEPASLTLLGMSLFLLQRRRR